MAGKSARSHILNRLTVPFFEPLHRLFTFTAARATAAKITAIQIPSILFTPNMPITIPEHTRLSIPVMLLNTVSAMLCPRLRRDGETLVSVTLRIVGSKIPIPKLIRPEPAKIMAGDTAQYANRQPRDK